MGEEILKNHFSKKDFSKFAEQLQLETELLEKRFVAGEFSFSTPKVGVELEAWLLDENFFPAPVNETFLKKLNNPFVVHELSKFNVELNTEPYELTGYPFSQLKEELVELCSQCQETAATLHAQMVLIGMLPTLTPEMLSLKNMSDSKRYEALNEQILKQRGGKDFALDITGRDHLKLTHDNVMLEATATSLQIHRNLPLEHAVRYYNTALLLSAPMVALAANSPFLFGKRLWEETRIPVFEQVVGLESVQKGHPVGRVSLGSGYLKDSLMELFWENLKSFPPLLPICYQDSPEHFRHLLLHNGTIWRWNRPLIGKPAKGDFHLRLEHRVAPAGPSLLDVVANIAFFVGALEFYAHQSEPLEEVIPYQDVYQAFYECAQKGLGGQVMWKDLTKISVQTLLIEELIPNAARGLASLGVVESEIRDYLENILVPRVQSGQNGSGWQQAYWLKHGQDFHKLTQAYVQRQRSGEPVHQWSV